jgi:hypothetical protein
LSDIAHGVDRADHLLLADHDLVEQTFKLCGDARVDQRRIGLLENPEQRQASLGGDDVLALGGQKTLLLQPPDDLGSGRRRANALASFNRSRRTSSSTKRQAFCMASIRVPSL